MRLTFSFGRRTLDFAIGRPTKADPAPRMSGSAEEIIVADDENHTDLPLPPQPHEATLPSLVNFYSQPQQRHTVPPVSQQNPAESFWDALDPTEREALRSVASWRTFAAGARLMEEGERADHVIVILGGRVKVCVDDNGREQVLAVRGLGQLVGERAALKVSVRSATVVALDMVWALVVQTKDFAAFISAHPRVLDIVQGQLYQRSSEQSAIYGYGQGSFRAGPADGTAAPSQPEAEDATRVRRRLRPLNGENCTVFLTDVVGFGARMRTDSDRLMIREVLFRMTQAAMQAFPDARSEDRGDGFLTVVPPAVSTVRVIDQLMKELPGALELHNTIQRESARFKLRLALNVGPVVSDMGVSGEAIIVAARLVEAPHFKQAIAESSASLGVIASPFVYETAIRHGTDPKDVENYSEVPVEVKESDTTAWMKLFDATVSSPFVPRPFSSEPPHQDVLEGFNPSQHLSRPVAASSGASGC